jgi:hypothetical protein
MYNWLIADLDANQQDWTIVYQHVPPYSRGGRDSDDDSTMTKVRTIYNPVFEDGGVDLVMAGHSHTYERSMLIDGHYGIASTLTEENIINGGDGDPSGDGPYVKSGLGNDPHMGTVYVVNGVGANTHADGGLLDHPIMVSSYELEGSMVIDVNGGILDAYFISRYGDVLDRFQIVKAIALPVDDMWTSLALALTLVGSAWMFVRRAAQG